MTRIKECVLYREFEHGEILDKMTALMDACEKSAVNAKEMEEDFYECVNGLIEMAGILWICRKSVAQLSDSASGKSMKMLSAQPVRSEDISTEASMSWHYMILQFSRNCMILT